MPQGSSRDNVGIVCKCAPVHIKGAHINTVETVGICTYAHAVVTGSHLRTTIPSPKQSITATIADIKGSILFTTLVANVLFARETGSATLLVEKFFTNETTHFVLICL
jgi:hypothetical protein